MAAVQRVRQGLRALLAFSQAVDYALAARYLSPAQMALFRAMSRSEQLHSLNVLRSVLAQSLETPHDLAVAALLHDCGKSRYRLAIWQKTMAVLVTRFAPGLVRRLSGDERLTFWRAPFSVRQHHPAWSARLMAAAGTSERAVWLAAHHADSLGLWPHHPYRQLLERLKRADDTN